MGKVKGADRNKPTNSSLSLTLNKLRSRVEITSSTGQYDTWEPLQREGWILTQLSERGRKRYLTHFEFLKQKLGITGSFIVRSANNFPSDCGIASSASSFAALTQATYGIALSQNKNFDLSLLRLAELSRIGSGSSIRSFLSPLVLWDAKGISSVEVLYKNIFHQVVVVDQEKKAIGSSDAHERVTTSLLFDGRVARAEKRLQDLLVAFQALNWAAAYQIVLAEFWDMHALFATAQPSFRYMSPASLDVLNIVSDYWVEKKDGPLVTMDAGANVHLIYREDQTRAAQEVEEQIIKKINEQKIDKENPEQKVFII